MNEINETKKCSKCGRELPLERFRKFGTVCKSCCSTYNVTDTQIKRSLNEIMDSYGLNKAKANKALKEQYNIKSDGYPNIIIEDI